MSINMGYYLYDEKIFYTKTLLKVDDILNKDITELVLGFAKSKFPKLNVLSYYDNDDSGIIALVSLEDGKIYLDDLQCYFNMACGDMILLLSDSKYSTTMNNKLYKFSYTIKKELFGTGNKIFQVTAKISDEYKIKVYANDENDAIKQVYNIPISEWEHPTIEPGLIDRQIIRHARWGNLSAAKLEDF